MCNTLEGKILRLKEELAKAEAEFEIERQKSPEIRLADLLHKTQCRSNHIDGCSWEYEANDAYHNDRTEKNRYYRRAVKILEDEDIDTVTRIISKITDIR